MSPAAVTVDWQNAILTGFTLGFLGLGLAGYAIGKLLIRVDQLEEKIARLSSPPPTAPPAPSTQPSDLPRQVQSALLDPRARPVPYRRDAGRHRPKGTS